MRIRLSLLIGVAVCVSVTVFAQEKAQVSEHEGKVLALEAIWNRAERSKDTNALSQIFAPNMTYVDSDGSLRTRDQFLAKVKNETDPPDQLVTEEATTRSFGDCIVVTGTYHGKWTKNGKVVVPHGRFTDTWSKGGGNWQCVASQTTGIVH